MRPGFKERVYQETSRIPRGKVATYSYIAKRADSPRAVRAVGNILNRNPNPGTKPGRVPCHRVVRSDRTPGGFARGTQKKILLLKKEGISFENNMIPKSFFL
jgi:methylated-DNA-protein-cysteine methyltransferase-like protein